jgi:hypothetical protein
MIGKRVLVCRISFLQNDIKIVIFPIMAILNKIIDGLTGVSSMRKTRDFRMEAVKNMYDPTVYNEIASRQRTKATEGLSTLVEQQALRRTADQMNRPVDYSMTGGNAARGMAMSNMQQIQGNRAYGEVATQLAQMDETVRNQYGDAYTETVGMQSQMMGQRRAGLANEQAMFNEERDFRRRALGANIAQTALAGIALPFAGQALGSAIGGAIAKSKSASIAKGSIIQAKNEIRPESPSPVFLEPDSLPEQPGSVDYGSMFMQSISPTPMEAPTATQQRPIIQPLPPFMNKIPSTGIPWYAKPVPGMRFGQKRQPTQSFMLPNDMSVPYTF